ncbi:conjugated bile salt MFS transporter [uncultured Clostridium sp.]|uniref:conjugated bile salt MFS transporter n=1 Tax=uncultured Clostridium sp. TaxID=59620 RepID=UPI00261E459B|nr:conjugated bile salt MFS transporter [uncultured Clostridium sp.]
MTSSVKINSKKILTGWIILVGCMLIQAIPFSVASNIQPQFMSYVVKGEGFPLAGFSLIFTISTIVAAIASPIIGGLYAKYNAKKILIVGAILSGLGFMSFGLAESLWQFYLIGAITQVGTAVISSIGVPLLINSWFSEEIKGKAMGLAFAGGAFGNMFLQQFAAISLLNNGYKKSYFIFGGVSLLVGLIVTIFILKMPSRESDLVKAKNHIKKDENSVDISYSVKELKNVKYFWCMAVAFALIGLYISALMVQYPGYLGTEVKLAPALIGSVGSVVAIFSLLGNLAGGALFDKLGITKCIAMAGSAATIGCILLMLSVTNKNLAFGFAAFFGISIFSYIMGVAYMTGSFFGKKNYGAILGIINLMFAVGYATGSSMFGVIVSKMGYSFVWMIVIIMVIIAYILIIIASIGMKKVNAKRTEEFKNRKIEVN